MAKESRPNKPARPLKVEVARSRDQVQRDLRGLRYELDFPAKMRRSFHRQTAIWIGGAIVVGVVLVALPRMKKKIYVDAKGEQKSKGKLVEAGFLLGALRIAATLLKPVVTSFITKKMSGMGPSRSSAAKW